MDKVIEELALKQKLSVLKQKLNASIVDKNTGKRRDDAFVEKIVTLIESGYKFHSRLSVEKIALDEFEFSDKQFVKELTEYAIIVVARKIAKQYPFEEAYRHLVQLYENQPYSTHQTNVSVELNQYSTPVPIGYLLGRYIGLNYIDNDLTFLEPTAGNGMLTISGRPSDIVANEIDEDRLHILKKQGFKEILSQDATKPFPFKKDFDGIIANPPFGGATATFISYGYQIMGLDQQIIVKSLEYMKDNGRASFIFGGHTEYDSAGRIKGKKDKAFLNYLAHFFVLEDVINLDGKLYNKQGTVYPIRLILIHSRKEMPDGYYPLKNNDLSNIAPFSPHVVHSYDQLFDRINNSI